MTTLHPRATVVDETITVDTGAIDTIQKAVDWFERRFILGDCIIDVPAGTYDEAVVFEDLFIGKDGSLTLRGDTRVLAGLSYVDGAAGNQAGLTNGGDGTVTLANAGNVITVTMTVTNPDFDAGGWVSGDKILVYDNAGATAEYTIDSTLNNAITLTVAAPAVGNDATAICLLPDRRVERTAAGPCVSVDTVKGVVIDGFYLESSTGADCHGIWSTNGALVSCENVVTYVEDYGFYALGSYSSIKADDGACSAWGNNYGYMAEDVAQVSAQYSVAVNCGTFGYLAFGFSFISARDTIAVNIAGAGDRAYSAQTFSHVNATRATARQNQTAYYADDGSFMRATNTNANNNGNVVDYNPAPGAIPGYGNGNGNADLYAS